MLKFTNVPEVYVAGRIIAQTRLLDQKHRMQRDLGWRVTSSWLKLAAPDYPPEEERNGVAWKERARREARNDLLECLHCDLLVIDTLDESPTGGREVELGINLAFATPFILVGPVRNIFHELANESFPTWDAFWETYGG